MVDRGNEKFYQVQSKLYIKYKKEPNSFHEKTYKVFRSNLNKILRESERDHYEILLTENQITWKRCGLL